jgi:hypothetical protein
VEGSGHGLFVDTMPHFLKVELKTSRVPAEYPNGHLPNMSEALPIEPTPLFLAFCRNLRLIAVFNGLYPEQQEIESMLQHFVSFKILFCLNILRCLKLRLIEIIITRVYGSVTNNNWFWIG